MQQSNHPTIKQSHHGFTLVELMIAIFILSVILIMGAAATNYTVGKLKSKKTIDINTPIRNAFDIISQKMNTANDKLPPVYGFGVSGDILEIINKSGATTNCTTIGRDGTVLKMKQDTSCDTSIDIAWQAITPTTINVTAFSVSNSSTDSYFMIDSNPGQIPYTTVEITAQDPADPTNAVTVRTSYFLDYQTVNNLK